MKTKFVATAIFALACGIAPTQTIAAADRSAYLKCADGCGEESAMVDRQLEIVTYLIPELACASETGFNRAKFDFAELERTFGDRESHGHFLITYTRLVNALNAYAFQREQKNPSVDWKKAEVIEKGIYDLLIKVASRVQNLKPSFGDGDDAFEANFLELKTMREKLTGFLEAKADTVAIPALLGLNLLPIEPGFFEALEKRLESKPSTNFVSVAKYVLADRIAGFRPMHARLLLRRFSDLFGVETNGSPYTNEEIAEAASLTYDPAVSPDIKKLASQVVLTSIGAMKKEMGSTPDLMRCVSMFGPAQIL